MKRETRLGTLVFLFAAAPLIHPQVLQNKPNPIVPSEILGPQLIAWSQVQKPQPVSQPLPPFDRPVLRSQQQQPEQSALEPPRQAPAEQILTGTILKDGNRYVLKVSSSSTYELDDQDRAKKYEGKQVKVSGALDAKGTSLHVISIELIS